jgi:hypothetical protein
VEASFSSRRVNPLGSILCSSQPHERFPRRYIIPIVLLVSHMAGYSDWKLRDIDDRARTQHGRASAKINIEQSQIALLQVVPQSLHFLKINAQAPSNRDISFRKDQTRSQNDELCLAPMRSFSNRTEEASSHLPRSFSFPPLAFGSLTRS